MVPDDFAALDEAHQNTQRGLWQDIEELRASCYVPGEFRCPKCGFCLSQFKLSATTGAIGDRDEPGERCPNDGSPLWRVTWKERATDHYERATEEIAARKSAEAERDALREAIRNIAEEWDTAEEAHIADAIRAARTLSVEPKA